MSRRLNGILWNVDSGHDHGATTAFPTDLRALLQLTRVLPTSWSSSTPACSWAGSACGVDGNVIGFCVCAAVVQCSSFEIPGCETAPDSTTWHGSLDISSLPVHLLTFVWLGSYLSGALNLTALPNTLVQLVVSGNQFSGTPDLAFLPSLVQQVILSDNAFTGPLSLTHLPRALSDLEVGVLRRDATGVSTGVDRLRLRRHVRTPAVAANRRLLVRLLALPCVLGLPPIV